MIHSFQKLFLMLFVVSGIVCASNMSSYAFKDENSDTATSTNSRNEKWAKPLTAKGLSNLYKVSDELYRSAQPKKGGFTSLKDLGIKTVISLRETELDPELNIKEATGLLTVHVPIVTWNVDDRAIFTALRTIQMVPKPVLIHCRHGSDRTGLIVALYRILYQNWTKEDALEEMLKGGYGHHKIFSNLPQIIRQIDVEKLRAKVNEGL